VRAAKAEGKDLLVDFTGSDWCGWCIRLHKEVFAHDEWLETVQRDYILVALDFPRSEEVKAQVPNPDRNDELKKKYGIRGFPTILMMTPDGEVYGRTGYQPGGPEKYLEHMAELRQGRVAMLDAKRIHDEFVAADGDAARWKLWEEAVGVLESAPAGAPYLRSIADVASFGIQQDAANTKGAKLRSVKALVLSETADDEVMELARELDPKNAAGMLELVVNAAFSSVRDDDGARAALKQLDGLNPHGFKDQQLGFRLNLQAALWCAGPLQDEKGKASYGKRAKEIGTDDKNMLAQLEKVLG